MKTVILAGGMGTRLSEETQLRPKPMIEIGNRPILWHIMSTYSHYGMDEFIICCGYKGHMIKDYFVHYYMYQSDVTFSVKDRVRTEHKNTAEQWKVTLADTGLHTLTAGRILKIRKYLEGEDTFLLTYGDGVADVDIRELLAFHNSHGKIATISTTQPEGRFGAIKISAEGQVESFKEKARRDQSWVNIGYMVFHRKVFDYLGDGSEMLEATPFERLAADGEMMAYRHPGFWSPMDTIRDRAYLEGLWESGQAPWNRTDRHGEQSGKESG
ncbi:MAG: glucose-1-phosphate cytidylyltransferase [Lachnospiraceae bacterium]|nr:glucose-1-phosphate cytidylyltransferase [Lachnospiraceae bacterium]